MDEDNKEVLEEQEVISEDFDKEFLDGFNDGEITIAEKPDTDEVEEEETEEESPDDEEEKEDSEEVPETDNPEEKPEEETEADLKKDQPEMEKEKEEKPPEPLKVFFMGKEVDVPQGDVVNLVQKGMNHDRMAEKLKQMEEDHKYLDQFLDMAAYFDVKPEDLIKHSVEGYKDFEIQKFLDKNIPEEDAKELFNQRLSNAKTARANQPKPKGKERDMTAEINDLFTVRPDLRGIREFPKEVTQEITKGVDAKTAYMKYENKKLLEEKKALEVDKKTLEEQLKAIEQKQKNAKAPKSVKGTGASTTKTDAFLVGFNEDY